MNVFMKPLALAMMMSAGSAVAAESVSREELEQRISELESMLSSRLDALADAVDAQSESSGKEVHIGGYGELHYNHLNADGEDQRLLDLHRMVLFLGYDYSDRVRFISEFEVEHTLVSGGSEFGAVEIEQAYVEIDVRDNMQFRTGVMLMPLGIVNETHEPPTFYGVERPVIETSVIPSTWYSAGVSLSQNFDNGISYDVLVTEGLKTEDPTSNDEADPFYLKGGKQKASYADAFNLALTGRVRYRGIAGLELAAYAQYQPDLDQSAETSYAESATLMGGHVIYQLAPVTLTALYARWDVAGDAAAEAGKDLQDGGYLEASWQASDRWGAFVRHSVWSEQEDESAAQSDIGVNFYPHPDVVFKADYQLQNDDAGNVDGFNLGMGYQF